MAVVGRSPTTLPISDEKEPKTGWRWEVFRPTFAGGGRGFFRYLPSSWSSARSLSWVVSTWQRMLRWFRTGRSPSTSLPLTPPHLARRGTFSSSRRMMDGAGSGWRRRITCPMLGISSRILSWLMVPIRSVFYTFVLILSPF